MAMIQPMTDLEAVNRMLASIGQAPVNTLQVSGFSDVSKAKQQLLETTRDVLAVGWSFNTDEAYTLTPDPTDGAVLLPNGVIEVDANEVTTDYTVRRHPTRNVLALYDKTNQTFDFSDSETVSVDIIWGFEFNDLPQAARSYIATAAARRFQAQQVSSTILDRFNEQDEQRAFLLIQRFERRQRDTNSFRANLGLRRWTRRRAF